MTAGQPALLQLTMQLMQRRCFQSEKQRQRSLQRLLVQSAAPGGFSLLVSCMLRQLPVTLATGEIAVQHLLHLHFRWPMMKARTPLQRYCQPHCCCSAVMPATKTTMLMLMLVLHPRCLSLAAAAEDVHHSEPQQQRPPHSLSQSPRHCRSCSWGRSTCCTRCPSLHLQTHRRRHHLPPPHHHPPPKARTRDRRPECGLRHHRRSHPAGAWTEHPVAPPRQRDAGGAAKARLRQRQQY